MIYHSFGQEATVFRIKPFARKFAFITWLFLLLARTVVGFDVVVDYTYDTRGFFDAPERRIAIEAVAERYSRILTNDLMAVEPILEYPEPTAWRIGFEHPGTGEAFELSTAPSAENDSIINAGAPEADFYGFPGLNQNEWILFVGGRPLEFDGLGGSGTGRNFATIFDDPNGPLHRGVIPNTPILTQLDLVAWGGSVAFDENTNWHFDVNSVSPPGTTDFYSIALHEIGHAFGLSTATWNQLTQHIDDLTYDGPNALEAFNRDNDAEVSFLELQDANDNHWLEGQYQSKIYPLGRPNLVGTVGDELQDLLMEPIADLTSGASRLELTNVDVGGLIDLGWSVHEDFDGDGTIDPDDVVLACNEGVSIEPYLEELGALRGDINFDTEVGFADFLQLAASFGTDSATYVEGDLTCDEGVGFDDFLILSSNFGQTASAVSVPEPSGSLMLWLMAIPWCRKALGWRGSRRIVMKD